MNFVNKQQQSLIDNGANLSIGEEGVKFKQQKFHHVAHIISKCHIFLDSLLVSLIDNYIFTSLFYSCKKRLEKEYKINSFLVFF